MARILSIHPENPQPRLCQEAAALIAQGGVVAYPTDSGYALGCHLDDKSAVDRIRRIRDLDAQHNFTLMCRDLSELSSYARVDNIAYRVLKSHTPGPYTFVLDATREVPKRLMHPKRKTIGLRVCSNPITQGLLDALAEPMMSVTLILPGQELPMLDAWEIQDAIGTQIDRVIDGGYCGMEPTTVVDLTGDVPKLLRKGAGNWQEFSE